MRAFYLFILHLFLRCVIYLYRTLFCCKLFCFFRRGGGGGFNTKLYLFKRCNSLMSSISSNCFYFFLFLEENARLRSVLWCRPDCVRPLPVHGNLTLMSWSGPTSISEFLSDIKE